MTKEEIIELAEKESGKTSFKKNLSAWLNEDQLPPLYWSDGEPLTRTVIKYLMLQMSTPKDIRIGTDAKPILDLIDKTKSHEFASYILTTYLNAGADTKQKFFLTLGSILGGPLEIDLLHREIITLTDNMRGKMAENIVKALALNGSTKALRAIEFFSRKYKSKNKNIGKAANEAFVLVAEELGIHPYDLADSIIPDFGFDGLFKHFEINGEPYRVFIGNDFKLIFLNEDNKVIKNLPKAASKDLQAEFKDMTKELKDIIKSQLSRMELYLIVQRKWPKESWTSLFLNNPVLFVFAFRLVWGAYKNGTLQFAFKAQEDQSLIDKEGQEIELDQDMYVGIVHPLSLSQADKDNWLKRNQEANLQEIFPQLTRPTMTLRPHDKGVLISKEPKGIKVPGYGFVSRMDKTGWSRGSVVDAGGISSYYKDFPEAGVTAILTLGGISVGYLEVDAELEQLMFTKSGSVRFGSYIYDEPKNETDHRLIAFSDVPPIVYSEVLSDMSFFLNYKKPAGL